MAIIYKKFKNYFKNVKFYKNLKKNKKLLFIK